jgi:glycosyltransferase A (GT-A) superfamily protein (DUF2064 family)
LYAKGIEVVRVAELPDFDTIADIDIVRRRCGADSRFARATAGVRV